MKTIIKIINFVGDNILKICAVLVVLILGVYVLIYIPYRDQQKIQQQEKKERMERLQESFRRKSILDCQSNAWDAYSENWGNNCKLMEREKDCGLPMTMSNNIEKARDKALENCIEINK
jgi:hypothetical protein